MYLERLESLGIMRTQLRSLFKSLDTIVLCDVGGVSGGVLNWDCRETPVSDRCSLSRLADCEFSVSKSMEVKVADTSQRIARSFCTCLEA